MLGIVLSLPSIQRGEETECTQPAFSIIHRYFPSKIESSTRDMIHVPRMLLFCYYFVSTYTNPILITAEVISAACIH